MTPSRLPILAAAALAVALSGTVPGASSAATPRSTTPACAAAAACHFSVVRDQHKTLVDGPGDTHSVDIEYDIYIPDVAVANPQPGIIHFNGLGGGKNDTAAVLTASVMALHGYVVLAYTSQGNGDPGNGNSGGVLELDAPEYDGKDARQMLDILAARPEVLRVAGDPQVGTTGGSYGGAIQALLAEMDPRVKVITPWRTFNDPEFSLSPNNLGLGYDFAATPVGVLKHVSAPPVALGWLDAIFIRGGQIAVEKGQVGSTCPGWDPHVCALYEGSVAAGRATPAGVATVRNSAPAMYLDPSPVNPINPGHSRPGLRVPTMLVQGEHDFIFTEAEAIATYTALRARGVPVEMIWQYGAHGYDGAGSGGGTGEGDLQGDLGAQGVTAPVTPAEAAAYSRRYLARRLVAFIDHHLRDPAVATGPGFAYYRDWVPYDRNGDAGPAFGEAPDFPPATTGMTFRLGRDGSLAVPGAGAPGGELTMVNPPGGVPASYTEQPNFSAPGSSIAGGAPNPYPGLAPSDPPGQALAFTSAPLPRDYVAVGVPSTHLALRSLGGMADITLFAKLFDVAPDGSEAMVPRAPAPSRVPLSGGVAAVDLKLVASAHRFAAGHRLRLVLASTDAAMTGNRAADVIGVDTARSSLTLPVLGTPPSPSPSVSPGGGLPATAASNRSAGDLRGALALALVGPLAAMSWRRRQSRERRPRK